MKFYLFLRCEIQGRQYDKLFKVRAGHDAVCAISIACDAALTALKCSRHRRVLLAAGGGAIVKLSPWYNSLLLRFFSLVFLCKPIIIINFAPEENKRLKGYEVIED